MATSGGSLPFASTWFKHRPMGGRERKKYSVRGIYSIFPRTNRIAPVV
jgi:hypothetical protein